MAKANHSMLYTSRIPREWLKVLLCFIVITNFGILATAIVSTITANKSNVIHGGGAAGIPPHFYASSSKPGPRYRLYYGSSLIPRQVFYFNTIPFALCVESILQLFKRWRRSLRPSHIVISSSISLGLCVIASTIWTTCIYTHRDTYWCPMRAPEWWPYPGTNVLPRPPNAYFLLPWLLIMSYISYGLLLLAGVVAYRRDRAKQGWQGDYTPKPVEPAPYDFYAGAPQVDYYPEKPKDAQKPPSAVFTSTTSISDGETSTLLAPSAVRASSKRSTIRSNATLPPSYDKAPSRASTRRYFEPSNVQDHVCNHCGHVNE